MESLIRESCDLVITLFVRSGQFVDEALSDQEVYISPI